MPIDMSDQEKEVLKEIVSNQDDSGIVAGMIKNYEKSLRDETKKNELKPVEEVLNGKNT